MSLTSDKMYNEVPVVGTKYNFGDWKLYAIHNDKEIKGFFGDYRWLSNFKDSPVWYEELEYPSVECAFQAQKIVRQQRGSFTTMTAAESKKMWKLEKFTKIYQGEHWDKIKSDIMAALVFNKFYQTHHLRNLLINTGEKYLEETNHWHDNFWGHCVCQKCQNIFKKNELGKILMKVRAFWTNL